MNSATGELFAARGRKSMRHRIQRGIAVTLLSASFISGAAHAQVAPSSEPLVQQANLIYKGSFRVPQLATTGDAGTYDYGGTSIAYNPANNSLFIVGYDPQQYLGEISIPAITNSTTIAGLATATVIQPLQDPLEGRINSINPTDTNPHKIGGVLPYGGNLYINAYSYYDGGSTQTTSQFIRPTTLSVSGQLKGPYAVGALYQGWVDGYMTAIPSEWQSPLGGPVLTGNCCLAITGIQSDGPAVSVYNPSAANGSSTVPATLVLGYPYADPLGTGWGTTSNLFNGSTHVRGIVFPPGTRSVLFFGRQGIGTFCYGPGSTCNDPADSSKGTHAYPYRHQIWAYDANDLLAVKNGTEQSWQVQPYGVWTFSLPFDDTTGMMDIGGAAFDPQTGNVYVSQLCADANCTPVIHVFNIDISSLAPNPQAPGNLQVH